MADKQIRKIDPHPGYPPEKGRYLRGNDYSPAAVVVILNREASGSTFDNDSWITHDTMLVSLGPKFSF